MIGGFLGLAFDVTFWFFASIFQGFFGLFQIEKIEFSTTIPLNLIVFLMRISDKSELESSLLNNF